MKKVAFCFLSHRAHNRHQLPIAAEFSCMSGTQVDLIVTTRDSFCDISSLLNNYPGHKCRIVMLEGGRLKSIVGNLKGRLYPNIRNVIRRNREFFLSYDALVTPHHNLEGVMKSDKDKKLKYICTFHGAGDGNVGFDKKFSAYDLLLAAGSDILERFELEGLLHSGNEAKVVGYPKLDFIVSEGGGLFSNDIPVFLYNPHYASHLESWSIFGMGVLDFFSKNTQYNLVLAPHIKLFEGRCPDAFKEYREYSNIIIDLSSDRLMDATYTKAADVYIGDCSSQVYEFLYFDLKPVLFLNARDVEDWCNDPNYKMWGMGRVISVPKDLACGVNGVFDAHGKYVQLQKEILSSKFSKTDESAGRRGARVIFDFLSNTA